MRIGEWPQDIDHLNIFMHAQKHVNGPATSLQLGHNNGN
jgi:hypothetical protein